MKVGMLPSERDLELKLKISKLPLWAQDHIRNLERERETAIRALNEYCDIQTPSPFYCEEYESTGEDQGPTLKRRYFQGDRLSIEWKNITAEVYLRTEGPQGDSSIEISWDSEGQTGKEIAMIPKSFQRVALVAKENMR
jgi:hypothetical protein